ncbi:helix-turn-helix domain-containing protein [Tianweitania sediminis]
MTLTKLAELNGLDPSACRQAGSRVNRKAEAAIADFLGVAVAKLFPDRYPIRTSKILSSKYDKPNASLKSRPQNNRAA